MLNQFKGIGFIQYLLASTHYQVICDNKEFEVYKDKDCICNFEYDEDNPKYRYKLVYICGCIEDTYIKASKMIMLDMVQVNYFKNDELTLSLIPSKEIKL